MRWILALFPMVILARQAFGIDVDISRGLSSKNALLYAALLIVAVRMVSERRLRLEMPAIQLWFVILIVYAVASWAMASFVIQYPDYPIVENGIFLKILLIDYFLIFLAYFYGPRTIEEAVWTLKMLLLVVLGVQLVTVGEALGLIQTEYVEEQESGRPEGLVGDANQSASFAALFLPMFLTFAIHGRGVSRWVWTLAVLCSVIAFLITSSRGATIGVIVAVLAGAYLLRRQLSSGLIIRWAAVAMVVLLVGVSIASIHYGDLLYQRFIVDTFGGTVEDASMGRTMLWAQALDKMVGEPITFVTGFGWRVYWSLPNVLSPHNTYLNLWFNLGLIGVAAYLAIFGIGLRAAVLAAESSSSTARGVINAFVFAIISAAVGLFFVEWYQPWPYFWAYFGLCMRVVSLSAVEQQRSGQSSAPEPVDAGRRSSRVGRGEFGWSVDRKAEC